VIFKRTLSRARSQLNGKRKSAELEAEGRTGIIVPPLI
jgi:hypothetical protein